MTLTALLLFLPVYALAALSPGPAVAAVVARALGSGLRRTLPFIGGIVLGDVVWFTLATLGLAALAERFAGLFVAVRILGALYLLYLAMKLWRAPVQPVTAAPVRDGREQMRSLMGGLSLTMGNPKVMVFFVAILPSVVDLARIGPLAYAELIGCIVVVLGGIMLGYAVAAGRARRAVAGPRAMRFLNRTTGAVMAGAAVAIVARS